MLLDELAAVLAAEVIVGAEEWVESPERGDVTEVAGAVDTTELKGGKAGSKEGEREGDWD